MLILENSISLKCSAYVQNFIQKLKWKRHFNEITSNMKYQVFTNSTKFSNTTYLNITNLNINDEGFYTCELYKITDKNQELIKSQDIAISIAQAPVFLRSNLNSTMEIEEGEKFELICDFRGKPKPIITWYKNNESFTWSERRNDGVNVNDTFTFIVPDDDGVYRCEGRNIVGTISKEAKLNFKSKSIIKWNGIIIGVLAIFCLLTSIIICTNHYKKKKLEKLLDDAGLKHFEEGQLDSLNPELGIDDQVDLLPYDHKYEFSIKNLELGKILGSGAFGVVIMAEAKGILPGERVTTVAVKMVDNNAQQVHIKALVAELKILIHLGKHLNVVNLLGACTKKIAKRQLLVIEEYCRYGNMQTYLYRKRGNVINQVDPQTGQFNFERNLSNLSMPCTSTCNSGRAGELSANLDAQINQTDYINNSDKLCNKDEAENDEVISYENITENNRSVNPISTKDLLVWSFQVARGMEYLVSRRVLHGDLAARNILLSDGNVVKICDFGLAKRMYKMDSYKKTSDCPLPVRWMSIESIRDKVFSSQSDVWSFGIVLWEFFSFAKTPYPGMEADEKLFAKLENGYRLEAPECSSIDLYQLMLECWSSNPLDRPTFPALSKRLGLMLEDSVRMHYIKLNDPYIMRNNQSMKSEENDYLNMIALTSVKVSSTTKISEDKIENFPDNIEMNETECFHPLEEDINTSVIITKENRNFPLSESLC